MGSSINYEVILIVLNGFLKGIGSLVDAINRASQEGRDLTAEEIEAIKAHQKVAEDAWQEQLKKLREGA